MRKSTRFIGALAVAGIIAAAGSAFTATSNIDHGSQHVGAVSQSISGVNVTNVSYTVDSATDTTTGVSFHVAETLDAWDTVTATISGEGAPATATCTPTDGTPDGTDLACAFAPGVVAVTDLEIVSS